MLFFVKLFLTIPLVFRVAFLFLIVLLVWRILGKCILWICSIIPFVLEKFFALLYQIIELPVSILHKKFGTFWGRIDNAMASVGDKVVSAMDSWYNVWHTQYKFKWSRAFIIYFICLTLVVTPAYLPIETKFIRIGTDLYFSFERPIVEWVVKQEIELREKRAMVEEQESSEEELPQTEIQLIVTGVNSRLLVRDIPDTVKGTAYETLQNGETVIWNGELVFTMVENGHVEPWGKIVTQNGVEGWCRLYYLTPVEYEGTEYFLQVR